MQHVFPLQSSPCLLKVIDWLSGSARISVQHCLGPHVSSSIITTVQPHGLLVLSTLNIFFPLHASLKRQSWIIASHWSRSVLTFYSWEAQWSRTQIKQGREFLDQVVWGSASWSPAKALSLSTRLGGVRCSWTGKPSSRQSPPLHLSREVALPVAGGWLWGPPRGGASSVQLTILLALVMIYCWVFKEESEASSLQ